MFTSPHLIYCLFINDRYVESSVLFVACDIIIQMIVVEYVLRIVLRGEGILCWNYLFVSGLRTYK